MLGLASLFVRISKSTIEFLSILRSTVKELLYPPVFNGQDSIGFDCEYFFMNELFWNSGSVFISALQQDECHANIVSDTAMTKNREINLLILCPFKNLILVSLAILCLICFYRSISKDHVDQELAKLPIRGSPGECLVYHSYLFFCEQGHVPERSGLVKP